MMRWRSARSCWSPASPNWQWRRSPWCSNGGVDARLLTALGFAVFAVGLGLSYWQTRHTDYDEMFWPQIVRGVAIMFCLLPPTRLALGTLALVNVPDASGLFNLMRNLGGAIGLALIDTVIYGRAPGYAKAIAHRLQAGDMDTARFVGLPLDVFAARWREPLTAGTKALLQPLIVDAALTQAINVAWLMIAILTAAALLCVPFARRARAGGGAG